MDSSLYCKNTSSTTLSCTHNTLCTGHQICLIDLLHLIFLDDILPWLTVEGYNDVTWASWRLRLPANYTVAQQHVQANFEENNKASHWSILNKMPPKRKMFPCHWMILRNGDHLFFRVIASTHLPMNKMAAISETTFPYTFLLMERLVFRLIFHGSFFLKVQLTIFLDWFGWWLGAV